jgi:hypothetical protein
MEPSQNGITPTDGMINGLFACDASHFGLLRCEIARAPTPSKWSPEKPQTTEITSFF